MELVCQECKTTTYLPLGFEVSYFSCPHCRHYFAIDDTGTMRHKGAFETANDRSCFALGAKANFDEMEYTLTGILTKKDTAGYFSNEYTLEGRDGSLLFLAEIDGHWIKLELCKTDIEISYRPNLLDFRGMEFRLYDRAETKIVSAKGFFDIPIHQHFTKITDYIKPPFILSIEEDQGVKEIYLGEHISPSAIKKAFQVNELPKKEGIGIVQPFMINMKNMALVFCAVFILMIFTQNYLRSISPTKQVLDTILLFTDYPDNKEYISPPFTFEGGTAPLEISAQTNVDNSWASLQMVLVNEITNEEIYLNKDIEYYHGYSGGESWSEGSNSKNMVLGGIKAGRYHLTAAIQKAPEDQANNMMCIKVVWNPSSKWNLIWFFFLMLTFWGIIYFIGVNFETRRWEDSKFSPYKK